MLKTLTQKRASFIQSKTRSEEIVVRKFYMWQKIFGNEFIPIRNDTIKFYVDERFIGNYVVWPKGNLPDQKKVGHIFWKQINLSVKSGILQIVMLLKYKNFGCTMPKKRIFLKMIQKWSQNCDHLYLKNEKFASSLELFPPYKIKSNWTKRNF